MSTHQKGFPLQSLTQSSMNDVNDKYGSLWTREETILCFYLYCQIPFSRTNKSNPEVVKLANLLDRTIGSVVRKLGNLGAVDERLRAFNISGLVNYAKLDKEIFHEFVNNWDVLVSVSQKIIEDMNTEKGIEIIKLIEVTAEEDIIAEFTRLSKLPTEKQVSVNVRIRQSFFRRAVLSNYDNKCCICGVDIPELLIASHIVPWAKDENSRIDPQNGLTLSAFHDRAFDKGLITITPDYCIRISKKVLKSKSEFIKPSILEFEGKEINLLSKFLPKKEYLEWHNKNVFLK